MKIGVMVESFRAGLDGGLKAAAELGADGVQMYATKGETHVDKLAGQAGRELKTKAADLGLEFSAICADFGGHGFQIPEDNPTRIDDSKRVMDLALVLGCNVVTTHIGVLPARGEKNQTADKSHPRYAILAKACEELGRYGDSVGATFAIETGPEPAAVLCEFLDDIALPKGIGVNFDPANLAMVTAEDIPAATKLLGRYIVHTHAKDGLNLQPVDAELLYGVPGIERPAGYNLDDYIREVPLGEGAVPFEEYLRALEEVGFDGYLTIEREVGDQPRKDIELAVSFLRELLAGTGSQK
ncbi:MAG: sugar phosphate isomerase/epimerase [Phycisphaerae bacterium]|nr:sugar phosphate isomerase/epimerase [Phycisphaerae bacterium]